VIIVVRTSRATVANAMRTVRTAAVVGRLIVTRQRGGIRFVTVVRMRVETAVGRASLVQDNLDVAHGGGRVNRHAASRGDAGGYAR
jgi:hypothetical protein